jgi:DNA-binding protein HU-beta
MPSTPSAQPTKSAASRTAAKVPASEAASASAPKKTARTVSLTAIFEELANGHAMPVKQAHAMAAGMVDLVTGHLQNGDRVRMPRLGVIAVQDRPARTGRHPGTGQAIEIAAGRKIVFRVAKDLKAAV